RMLRQDEIVQQLDGHVSEQADTAEADATTIKTAIEEHELKLTDLSERLSVVVDQSNQIAELRTSLETVEALLTARGPPEADVLAALQEENRALRAQLVALSTGNNVLGKRKRIEDDLVDDAKRAKNSTYPEIPGAEDGMNGFSAVNALNALAGAAAAVGDDSIELADDDADEAYSESVTEDSEEDYAFEEVVPVSKRQAAKNLAKGLPVSQASRSRAVGTPSSSVRPRRAGLYKKNRFPPGSLPIKNPTPRNTKYACEICQHGGYTILYCTECQKCYHSKCLELEGNAKDIKEWTCPNCQTHQTNTKPPKESEAERRARNKGHAKEVLQSKTPSRRTMTNAEDGTPATAESGGASTGANTRRKRTRKTTEQMIADALNGDGPIDPDLEDVGDETEEIDMGDVTMAEADGRDDDRLAAVVKGLNPDLSADEQERELQERIRQANEQLDAEAAAAGGEVGADE
ncbi:hypothetical protein LTR66_015591, partial [Elasticomyces elasticus]